MQLTTFTDYSLRVLMYLSANPDRLSNVKEIAEYYDISRNHLVKVVHRLAQLDYITTTKGKGGGIQINESTMQKRLGDLVNMLEPNMNIVECFDKKTNTCKITNACKLKLYLFEAKQEFINTLNKKTLADTVIEKSAIE